MKTESPEACRATATDGAETALENLLGRTCRSDLPERIDGIVLGRIERVDPAGLVEVEIPSLGIRGHAVASLVPVTDGQLGKTVALGFESGDPSRPMILGYLYAPAEPARPEPTLRQENGRWVIEAETQLELRCGEARILLDADGHIHLRGTYITSHASASQRIRGGSVQIN